MDSLVGHITAPAAAQVGRIGLADLAEYLLVGKCTELIPVLHVEFDDLHGAAVRQ
jgi:hypothetical protein